MNAIVFESKLKGTTLSDVGLPHPLKGEVLIRLQYASLNHLDLWTWNEQTLIKPVVSGSDGSGVVQAVGVDVPAYWLGKEVIINPGLYWGDDEKMYAKDFQILGNSINGTFAEYIVVPQEYVHQKPAHLSLKQAAALPMAALTAYRALFTKAQLQANEKVLITGIGGGVALFATQMAIAAGASVYVTSSSTGKIEKAIAIGATGGFNYRELHWTDQAKKTTGGFDVIIDSAGGNGFMALTEVANNAARIVLLGRTAGNINNLKPSIIFNKQLRIEGTVMGTPAEFDKMLYFFEQHKLCPLIATTYPLSAVEEAKAFMESGRQFGKIILEIQPIAKTKPITLIHQSISNY